MSLSRQRFDDQLTEAAEKAIVWPLAGQQEFFRPISAFGVAYCTGDLLLHT